MPVCRSGNLTATVEFLRNSGIKIIAATEKASVNYTDSEMNGPLAIIMGSEDAGISPALLRIADQLAKIPILGKIQSLNVSVAASLMIYEAVRQRSQNQG